MYKAALNTYGATTQAVVAIEEMSEVQKELCKAMRGRLSLMHLAEEVADAMIVLEEICDIFEIGDEVSRFMDEKVLRLKADIQKDHQTEADLLHHRLSVLGSAIL